MMKTTELRKIAIVLVVLASSYVLLRTFMIEFFALGWHIRHGTKAQLQSFDGKKYEVNVPIFAWAHLDEDGKGMSIVWRTAHLRTAFRQPELGFMMLSVGQKSVTAEGWRELAPIAKKRRMTIVEVASLVVAGQELYCFEHTSTSDKTNQATVQFPMVHLTCASLSDRREFSASYTGTQALVPEFYQLLKAVRRIEN